MPEKEKEKVVIPAGVEPKEGEISWGDDLCLRVDALMKEKGVVCYEFVAFGGKVGKSPGGEPADAAAYTFQVPNKELNAVAAPGMCMAAVLGYMAVLRNGLEVFAARALFPSYMEKPKKGKEEETVEVPPDA